MLTRSHIELGAKLFVVALTIFFVIYTFKVVKMMGMIG